jgi:hypothetical protein
MTRVVFAGEDWKHHGLTAGNKGGCLGVTFQIFAKVLSSNLSYLKKAACAGFTVDKLLMMPYWLDNKRLGGAFLLPRISPPSFV